MLVRGEAEHAGGNDRSYLSLHPAGLTPRSQGGAGRRRRLVGSVRCAVPFATVPLTPIPAFVASYQSALAINDLITAILLFSQFAPVAVAGAAVACERISVHRGGSGRSRPDLSGPVCADRASGRRTADNSLALHGLARRISASRARLRAAERQGRRRQDKGSVGAERSLQASLRSALRCPRSTWVVTARHDILPTMVSDGHFTPDPGRRRVDGVVAQPRGPAGAVVSAAAFGDRHLADGRAVRLAVRHRVVGDPQRGQIRSGLLCRPDLRALCREFRSGGVAGRHRRPAGPDGPTAGEAAPAGGLRTGLHADRERLFGAVVESSNDAIITKALDGTITAWNRAAERLFGYTAAEAVGKHIDIIVPPDRRAELSDILDRVGRGEADRTSRDLARAQGRPDGGCFAQRLADPFGGGRDHRRLQDRARHHRKQADAAGAQPGNRGAAAHFRDLAGSHPGHRHRRKLRPGQPELDGHPRLSIRRK